MRLLPPTKFLLTLLISLTLVNSTAATTIDYLESEQDISNPDRGFYYPYTTTASNFSALSKSELISRRVTSYTPFEANYQVRSSIGLRHFVLDSFVNRDTLSAQFLEQVQTDFNTARDAGVRLIVRFSYTVSPTAGACNAEFICPPYGDAPKARVLSHIAQLKPIIERNADVIMGIQQGFVGTWGENYYSDYFGDPSINDDVGYLTNQNWRDRNDVVAAMLDAIPKSRMLQVRYPQLKQRFIGGVNAPLTTPALSPSQAFDQSDIARLGLHNDCFVASVDDLGTFADYGNDANPVSTSNSLLLKQYLQSDSRYTLVGGETCSDTYSPQNDCNSVAGGKVLTELEEYHYSFLNSDYNNEVNNDWQSGGCMEEIKRRLGYRFVLRRAEIPNTVELGGNIDIQFSVENTGYASAVNPRLLYLVLRSKDNTDSTFYYPLTGSGTNVQQWSAGSLHSVSASTTIERANLGEYEAYLHIADPSNNRRVFFRPEYSIQLANQGLWEPETGLNKLNATIKVTQKTSNSDEDDLLLLLLPALLEQSKREQ